jgi:hypothetical protein
MKLDQATLDRYKGGEIEIQNQGEGYIYRGEINKATTDGHELYFELNWMAKGANYPFPSSWERDDTLIYRVDLAIYIASDIDDGRICLNSMITGEITVLFPPNGSKLDQSKIKEKHGITAV